jgi:hypothetical protein
MAKNKFINDENTREYGADYVKVITKLLLSAGKRSSGKLIKSLSSKIQDDANKVQLIIEAENYFDVVDKGRKPGKFPPISAISKWASINGISQESVFPIAKKIFKYGIKPTNIIDKSIVNFERVLIPKLEDDVAINTEDMVFDKIKNEFKNIE